MGSFHSSHHSVSKPLGQFQEHPARCAGLLEGHDLTEGGAHLHTPCFLRLSPCPPSGRPAWRALHDLKKPKNQDATVPALVSSSDAGNQQSRWERCVREGNTFPPHPEAPIPALHSPHLEGQTGELPVSASPAWFPLPLLLSRFSNVQLCTTPETAAHQSPPSLGFSRQEHWSGLPFPSPMHESEK